MSKQCKTDFCIPESLNTNIQYQFLTTKYPLSIHSTHPQIQRFIM
jgi:hypothetical protein